MDEVRDHLVAADDVDPGERLRDVRRGLRHVVHGKSRADLDGDEAVEHEVRHACQGVSEERCVVRLDEHVVLDDVERLRVEIAFPEPREQAVAAVDDEAVDAQHERCAEDERGDEVDVAHEVDIRRGVCRLEVHRLQRRRDDDACAKQDEDHHDHDPVEDAQERAEEVEFLALDFLHAMNLCHAITPSSRPASSSRHACRSTGRPSRR